MSVASGLIFGQAMPSHGGYTLSSGVTEQAQIPDEVLVVDLDGTLLRSDMLYESFWASFGSDWRSPFVSAATLLKGRASLKRVLANRATIDAAHLPYDPHVLDYIGRWREKGGKTALVTASDQSLAHDIAAHLGLFDEVHGSDGKLNLKGEQKAVFLERRFGAGTFTYMGDSPTDLAVWKRAAKAVTVNAPASLRSEAERACPETEHLATQTRSLMPYVAALRPHQWLKNLLVVLPLLTAHQFTISAIIAAVLAFVCFSLVASSVYVLNDLVDLAADRAHPRKRNRPFASGAVPIAHGTWLAIALITAGAMLAAFVGPIFLLVMAGYYVLTAAYSLQLKRKVVIDIFVLAGLYTMRLVAGGVATQTPLSVWLLAFSMFFFLSLASVKRQAELIDNQARGNLKATGRGYHVDDLPIISMIAIGSGYVSVLVMALYINSPIVAHLYQTPEMLWGVCGVLLYWITRTVMVAHRGDMHDDPVVFAIKDSVSRVCLAIVGAFILLGTVA